MSAEQSTEKPQMSSDPETLLSLKEVLLTIWQQLPPEHQASMAMVMLESLINGQYRQWIREAIDLRWPVTPDAFPDTFGLVQLSFDDLRRVQFDEDEIAQLDEQDLRAIAVTMRNHYVHDLFWYELRYVTQARLEGKI